MNIIKVGSDFSGVGAFNQALNRLGIEYKEVFACDMDKYARQTFIQNYGEPEYYPTNVYEREIPSQSIDIYMTSPPCQSFSLAGKRLGKNDKRGILFFNSLEFIETNNPRFFIFENVKGLLSDNGGKTFSEWVNLLGGKSVNGNTSIFPYADSVPYHLYWKVLNAKHHGVPQNRERVFLVGIRDDKDNNFSFPAEEHLTKRLKDVLESEVNEKYFLSEKMVDLITFEEKLSGEIANLNKGGERGSVYDSNSNAMSCLSATDYKQPKQILIKKDKYKCKYELKNCINTCEKHYLDDLCEMCFEGDQYVDIDDIEVMLYDRIKINSATSAGYEEATDGDSINLEFTESKTRRGRVGKGVAQTLDTGCNQGVMVIAFGRSEEEKKRRKEHFKKTDYTNSITTVQKDNVIVHNCITEAIGRQGSSSEYIDSCKKVYQSTHQIRRLTPRECFRLMDFPDTFTWPVSDSQAYKQAGNSIVVNVLYKILKNLKTL
jgi:DNA (cytosine-5)-methyltransferase 1